MVGSLEEVKVGNKTVRARQYPWGVVQGKTHLSSIEGGIFLFGNFWKVPQNAQIFNKFNLRRLKKTSNI